MLLSLSNDLQIVAFIKAVCRSFARSLSLSSQFQGFLIVVVSSYSMAYISSLV